MDIVGLVPLVAEEKVVWVTVAVAEPELVDMELEI